METNLTNGMAGVLHRDHLGSVRAVTDAAAARVESAVYKPYGEQTEFVTPGLAASESKGWIGERYDADAGLQYLNARYYDPVLGMFLQPDWFEVLKPGVGTNRFSYSFNDPVNNRDRGGNIVETSWDAANLALGATSLVGNLWHGNFAAAGVDAVGLVLDGLATATPGVLAGAAASIRAERIADAALDATRTLSRQELSGPTRRALEAAGFAPTGSKFRHIVEAGSTSGPAWRLREKLVDAGIAINGFENGVGLVHHNPGRNANIYAEYLERRLAEATTREEILRELAKVRGELAAIDRAITDGTRTGLGGVTPSTVREWAKDQARASLGGASGCSNGSCTWNG